MNPFPPDIFSEPSADPDTLTNLGPLRRIAGTWRSVAGADVNPKPDGPEHRKFIEHIDIQPIDAQTNGPQLFYGLRYHTHINTVEEDITFYEQVGYWLYEPATGLILQTVAIPRGQVALAAGHAKVGDDKLVLTAERETNYGICSTYFLENAFRTDQYRIEITFHADGSWSYVLKTTLMVKGETEPFIHQDQNRLELVAEPKPNPLLLITRAKAAAAANPAAPATAA